MNTHEKKKWPGGAHQGKLQLLDESKMEEIKDIIKYMFIKVKEKIGKYRNSKEMPAPAIKVN